MTEKCDFIGAKNEILDIYKDHLLNFP